MNEDITLLCTGDLHLGRHPSRIPQRLDGSQFSPKAAWRSTVDEAIERSVDGVLVTGDVVDRANRYFEAYGPFEAGLNRLDAADVPVVVVSGNHDFDVLPQLMEGIDLAHVTFLGADGTWERTTIEADGGARVTVDGWSFPREHVIQSPLDEYDHPRPDEGPLIGLVHADLDAPESEYAPVDSSALLDTPADAWLLGHIHRPQVHRQADPLVVYPGSPQALDPGERGSHGPWVLTVDPTGEVEAEQLPLASLRYDELAVDVSEADEPTAIAGIVSDRVSTHVAEADTGPLELLLARVTLTGRTPAHGALVDEREAIEDQLSFTEGSLTVAVERLAVETRPAIDVEELAEGDSPAAYLADLLVTLESGDTEDLPRQLVADARDAMQRAHAASAYDELRREGAADRPDESDALDALERQARLLLAELLAQKEESG